MKRILLSILALASVSFVNPPAKISKEERKSAVKLLKDTEAGVFASVKGLSEAQLKFKPAPDRWSVEECLKHIAAAEEQLWQATEGALKAAADPAAKAEVKVTDDQLVKMMEDRSHKVKTSETLQPENIRFKTASEALDGFKAAREKLISFTKKTDDDLRNHVVSFPFGKFDCYQMILFIGAHSNRHTQQIEEVKADPNFPKN